MKLSDLCNVYSGYALKNFNSNGIGVPVIKIGNINSVGNLDLNNCQYTTDEVNEKYFSKYGDIYVALSGATTGKTGIMVSNEKYIINQRVGIIRCIDTISYEFIKYFLTYKTDEILAEASGCAQPNISPKQLAVYELPNYSIEKMCVIANKLNRIKSIINKRQQELDKLDELVKARFVEMFGDPVVNPKSWEIVPLSALIINANNGMARRGKDADGSIVLRLVELQNGFIDYSAPNRICLNDTEKKRYELVDNDFLFARVNGNPDYVGRCAVFKSIGEPVFHNDHIIRVHFDETKINGCFTSVLLNSDYGKRQMREQIKTSAGQYTISQDGIGAITAILPPLELQEQFAAFVEQTDKSKLQ